MRVLIFATTFVWNISHSRKKLTNYDQKYILVFMYGARYFGPILMKLEISSADFRKIIKY